MALIVPAMFGVGYAPQTGLLWVAIAFLILFGLGWGFFDSNNMPILCQIVRPELRATGYGIMNLVSISCGGFADWGFGMLRDRHVPLFGIFGVFASAAVHLDRARAADPAARRPSAAMTRDPIRCHDFVAAAHSPFDADGSLAPEVVPIQASFLAANGIRTVFITGTTGECHSLTCEERLALYDAWAAAGAAHGLAVIAHVGGNCDRGRADAGAARRARSSLRRSARWRRRTSSRRTWPTSSTGAPPLPRKRRTCRSTTTTSRR